MNEKQIETLEKMFPKGFIIIFNSSDESPERCGMYMNNESGNEALYKIAGTILENFEQED